MLAGHYVTGVIAKQKAPKGRLYHFIGIGHTKPSNILDIPLDKLMVKIVYSHDLYSTLVCSGFGNGIVILKTIHL